MNSDFKDLLLILEKFRVKHLIIGGYAVMNYSEPRYTKDLDIWIEASKENAERVYEALKSFGAPISSLTPDDFSQEGFFYQMGRPPVRIDILMSVKGVTFADAWARHTTVSVGKCLFRFISKEDLITSKRAAGRPQDLIDVEILEESDRRD